MNKQDKYEILANFLSQFQDKKWLLAKFLIDNDAINDNFIKRIQTDENDDVKSFNDINQLNSYLNNLINKESEVHQINLEVKLSELLEQERYEEAAKIRDWIKKLKSRK